MKTYAVTLALCALALLPGAGCEKRKVSKPRLGEVERLPRVESVVLGKPAKLELSRSYTATVDTLEKADLCAMVKGYVQDLPEDLDIGRVAKKGELLFALHVPDLIAERDNKKALVEQQEKAETLAIQAVRVAGAEVKESQAMVLRFEGDLEFRKAQYTRIVRLAQGDTLSKQQMDEAKLQLDAAQSAFAAAQAQVATKEARHEAAQRERDLATARVKSARTEEAKATVQVEFAKIRAPFNGVVTKRWVDTGATVKDPGMPLLTFMRTDKVRVIIDVAERDVPYISAGRKGNLVRVTIPALKDAAGTEDVFGNIALISSALDPITRTMRAEVHLDNKVGEKTGLLKPQMTGTARVILATREAFAVPSSALIRTGDKMELFVVADPAGDPVKGILKRLEVQTGLDDGLRVEIRGENLTGRELIVVKGAGVLRPGEQVIAMPARLAD